MNAVADAPHPPYGVLAEFPAPAALVEATRQLYRAGYRRVEAYTPYPVPDLALAMNFRSTAIPAIFLIAALLSGAAGYFMQWYATVISYPYNIGGRPLNSWPSFIPITFELSILGGVLCGAFSMLVLNRLPRYHHPVSNVESFRSATSDGFFLCVEARDEKFDLEQTSRLLRELAATAVTEIPNE